MQEACRDLLSFATVPLNVQVFWPLSVIVPTIFEVPMLYVASKTRQALEKVTPKKTITVKIAWRKCIVKVVGTVKKTRGVEC
jgi:hypothetical protein